MKKTKIDWCDCTINPVVGCPRGCEYCYARKMCKRYGKKWGVEDFSKPEFFPERLEQLSSKKPKSIFMDSMSDIMCWSDEATYKTVEAMRKNPQHNYIALTKNWWEGYWKFSNRSTYNLYLGQTIDIQDRFSVCCTISDVPDFLSIEPILEPISIAFCYGLKQVVIGAETGNRKGKVIPKKEWIDDIVRQADKLGTAVFMKESLRKLMGADFRQDKLIWEVSK